MDVKGETEYIDAIDEEICDILEGLEYVPDESQRITMLIRLNVLYDLKSHSRMDVLMQKAAAVIKQNDLKVCFSSADTLDEVLLDFFVELNSKNEVISGVSANSKCCPIVKLYTETDLKTLDIALQQRWRYEMPTPEKLQKLTKLYETLKTEIKKEEKIHVPRVYFYNNGSGFHFGHCEQCTDDEMFKITVDMNQEEVQEVIKGYIVECKFQRGF